MIAGRCSFKTRLEVEERTSLSKRTTQTTPSLPLDKVLLDEDHGVPCNRCGCNGGCTLLNLANVSNT